MTENQSLAPADLAQGLERVLLEGDLGKLSPDDKLTYYRRVCESLGLNPLTRPFLYVRLQGKEQLYATKAAADQLRRIYGISFAQPRIEFQDGLCVVTVLATDRNGRTDCDLGIVPLGHLQGEDRANAVMKAVTKAKRRCTLSLLGLGMLDETEVPTVPGAMPVPDAPLPSLGAGPAISRAQQQQLFQLGATAETVREVCQARGYSSTAEIPVGEFDALVEAIRQLSTPVEVMPL